MPELSSEYWKYALIVWTWLGAWTISSHATLTADRSDPVSDPYRGACRSWCVPDLVILVLRSFLTLCIEWLHYMCMASIAVDQGTPAGWCKCGCILYTCEFSLVQLTLYHEIGTVTYLCQMQLNGNEKLQMGFRNCRTYYFDACHVITSPTLWRCWHRWLLANPSHSNS